MKELGIQHEVDASKAPILNVTVFSDRVEVTRVVKVQITQAGSQKVVLCGITNKVDKNSIRVAGGKGKATILEVSYDERYVTEEVKIETPDEKKNCRK
eukprot:TRINITY_DN17423_c0_g1_i1.p2 TRINITY_DN17423_c0_g1~~TRINITY_DN17423_c0_g1_i1.p2  ORF type:complete len:112 (+),score=25.46 TRINITY_DN17423_c0_g1_i1:44-337(+)